MKIARFLLITLTAVCLATSTGCQEPMAAPDGSLDSSVEKPSQALSEDLDRSSSKGGSPTTTMSDQAKADQDESKLRVDVDEEGVEVKVGEAIDVTIGEEGVGADEPPQR